MNPRTRPIRHRNFYPGDLSRQIADFLSTYAAPGGASPLVAAVVPHAGWSYSGGVAARTLKALSDRTKPRAVIVFGAVHRAWITSCAVYPEGEWLTPLGAVSVDAELAREVLAGLPELLEVNAGAHDSEHSIEVQMPFIHQFFKGLPVLPIMVPPDAPAVDVGAGIARLPSGKDVVVVASSDLTHYGEAYGFDPAGLGSKAHAWMRQNDERILDLIRRLEAERVCEEAERSRNACGPGAIAAAVAFARERGAKGGVVLERTDSHEVQGSGEPFHMAVGYAGVVM